MVKKGFIGYTKVNKTAKFMSLWSCVLIERFAFFELYLFYTPR
jgi:hypothetical protein